MNMISGVQSERDYLLGTHNEELERLGLQHRVWRPHVLDCWSRAGINVGKRVIDVGAGPGYVTTDLAEIVGPTGQGVAVEQYLKIIGKIHAPTFSYGLDHAVALIFGCFDLE